MEIKGLQRKNTSLEVEFDHESNKKKVPRLNIYVFNDKFDENRYLIKHKALLYCKGDLQNNDQDKFAVTLTA